ncbi:MAG TPA: DUF2062 domain-containing protein [Moraxellaceae bacterium]|nr:DUF2062 domain-containing protein [Moraxellaceae bacterium]
MPKRLIRRYLPHPDRIIHHRSLRFLGKRLADPSLWHLNKRSAAGAAFWGLWCAFLPMPLQMLPAAAAAILFRVNLPMTVVLVWVSNPLTMIPLIYVSYFVGSLLLGIPMPSGSEIHQLVGYLGEVVGGIFSGNAPVAEQMISRHIEPLLLGTLVTGFLFGCTGYVLMRIYWRWHVVSTWKKRQLQRNTPHA